MAEDSDDDRSSVFSNVRLKISCGFRDVSISMPTPSGSP